MRPLEPTTVEASIHVVVIILEVMGMGKPPWANGVVALLGETPPHNTLVARGFRLEALLMQDP
jgi:hypothetical protein